MAPKKSGSTRTGKVPEELVSCSVSRTTAMKRPGKPAAATRNWMMAVKHSDARMPIA